MAKNVKIGDIVEWQGYHYRVTSVTNDTRGYILGHNPKTTSNLLQLTPVAMYSEKHSLKWGAEEPNGWINERTVKLLKKHNLVGMKLARQMKKDGYSDSEIVQETGYHI